MEAFLRMLLCAQDSGIIRGVRASMNGLNINQLFFVDDALLFMRNKKGEVEAFMNILNGFEKMSRQKINLEKSMVYFSPNTPTNQCELIRNMLRMKVVEKLDNYLDLLLYIRKMKSLPFKDILNRVIENMNSKIRRMWWACKNKDRGWAMMAWDNICVPKGIGGLDFKDLHLFNLDPLGRQA
ncbi:reverse transcriptase [Gossypium australe]|uniref:Reverse transcriptase n=1 Tax=Gossypium australe TaxID=47621 RepID=A0A5B6WU39_9ROSI|nr:reverse transcriptase [Gossypium australe]